MSSSQIITKQCVQKVRPILSADHAEAHRRVLRLYKDWCRKVGYLRWMFNIERTNEQIKERLRQEFYKNKNVKDLRAIDLLVVKGNMEYKEAMLMWKQSCHMMMFFEEKENRKSNDYLTKFIEGRD